jgi:hypothetical protein
MAQMPTLGWMGQMKVKANCCSRAGLPWEYAHSAAFAQMNAA